MGAGCAMHGREPAWHLVAGLSCGGSAFIASNFSLSDLALALGGRGTASGSDEAPSTATAGGASTAPRANLRMRTILISFTGPPPPVREKLARERTIPREAGASLVL